VSETIFRVRTDKHAPDIQAGDALTLQPGTPEPGQLALVNIDGDAVLRHYEPGMTVLGVVTWLYRTIPGAETNG
jgi:hypothetical protein